MKILTFTTLLTAAVSMAISASSCARPHWVGITGISNDQGEITIHINTCGHEVQRIEIRGDESAQTHRPIAIYERPEVVAGSFSVNTNHPAPGKAYLPGFRSPELTN